ncbi:MAG: DUF4437 domain-containing protein [Pseudomonadota bacterium]
MTIRTALLTFAISLASSGGLSYAAPKVEVVTRADFELVPLNPLRGDASPKAGVLWGDLRKNVPTGALIQFADGFSSPPHIHNITYRAVVIEGTVHNDDPDAENMWMGPGSFWTQPAGEVHITAVGPGGGTAFLETLSGPYLVQPSEEAFDNGERPINIEERNVVWLDSSDIIWVQHDADSPGPEIAFLWGKLEAGQLNGTFVKLPADYAGELETGGVDLKAVVVKGQVTHGAGSLSRSSILEPGSYFGSEGDVSHSLSCAADEECVIYIRTAGRYSFAEAE